MSKTETNLAAAFAGESQANRRYLAFAQRAADEYKEGVYKLFRVIAEGETIHALKHLQRMKAVRSTRENLAEAIAGEANAFQRMYPRMIAQAREEGHKDAEITLRHAMEVEKVYHELLRQALDNPDAFPVQDDDICRACGYMATEKAPASCPVCWAVASSFYRAFSESERGVPNL